jgi:hypothetical protein
MEVPPETSSDPKRFVWSMDGSHTGSLDDGSSSTNPSPVAATRTAARSAKRAGSPDRANAATSPAAIRGSSRSLASSVPPARSASAATSDDRRGEGASDRPTSSSTIIDSSSVKPAPPQVSGTASAATPICSHSVCQSASS